MVEREDKRVRRTKKMLRLALTRLIQQKEFHSITVTDVVREADINRGTFYAHYRDVSDLRRKIEDELTEDFCRILEKLRPNEVDSLQSVLCSMVDFMEANRETINALHYINGPDGVDQCMARVIENRLIEFDASHPMETTYVARCVSTGLISMLNMWVSSAQPLPKNELVELMEKLLVPLMERYSL